jgi:hypothetical protein
VIAHRRSITRVPAIVPWADPWQAAAACAVTGVTFAEPAAWRTTRGPVIESVRDRAEELTPQERQLRRDDLLVRVEERRVVAARHLDQFGSQSSPCRAD